MLMLDGIFLVMPIISGALITLVHLLMVRTPQRVQITARTLTVLAAWALFITRVFEDSNLDGLDFVYDGAQASPSHRRGYLSGNLPGHRYRTWLVAQARYPPARLSAVHDCESTACAHGVRALHLRERRPLEARQRAQLPAPLGCSGAHGATRGVSWSSRPP